KVAPQAAAAGCPAHAPAPAAVCPAHHATPAGGAADAPSESPPIRIRIDRDLCQGHAVCVGEAPEIFALGRDQKVILKVPRPPAELHAKVRAAAEHCPTRTIRLEETSES